MVGALENDPDTVMRDSSVHLSTSGQERLVQWCIEYGLLGLLPHQTVLASLAPRWEILGGSGSCVPTRRVHRRDVYGWSATFDALLQPLQSGRDKVRAGDLVDTILYRDSWAEPQALVRTIRDGGWSTQHLSEAWGSYFPGVPPSDRNTYTYPVPESEAFWTAYCEPVAWLLGAADLLRVAIQQLDPDADTVVSPESFLQRIDGGMRSLHNLLAPVQPSITIDASGYYRQTWRTGSLLASFALMAMLDLTERRRVLTCKNCGRVYVSAAHSARYCSTRCHATAQKRAYRARARERQDGSTR
jgi:hypothetical protein